MIERQRCFGEFEGKRPWGATHCNHWHGRDSRSGIEDAYERGGAMALFRHHLDNLWKHTQAWSNLDNVVLTPDLARGIAGASVLLSLEGHDFLTAGKQVPRSPNLASDHLPVVCQIHYQ